ncbi:metallophosphoesterase family protein [Lysinibacillus telephonicus]|uniref:Serine/threonine protein phosphatase n=1 Tax=Lysinibacillus telephonicus TaxID=1714840 RepID=A0A3S0QT72_9BACI|nr:metallophosphoesterase [Lysinibacillus telephonicus]RTQ91065.1 serine/threonine protein phosphatase [Lysinibacillus telephonicus]
MIVLLFVLVICIGLVLFMIKQAFENNLLHHSIELAGDNEQVRFFFISDVHVRKIDEQMIKRIDRPIHAVIIGGDFADKRTPIERIYQNINLLKKLGPIYFVWGNNDREVGEQRLRRIFSELDVHIIENDALTLPNSHNKIWLSAIDDTSTKNAQFDMAFEKTNEEDYIVFISHNPQVFYKVRQQYHADVMLGGHLHGGQIRLGKFGIHPHGSFKMNDGVATIISNGYGTTLLPMRLGAKPQCHMIDLNFTK